MKNLLLLAASIVFITSCGGGGGDSKPPAVIKPSFSFVAPTTITNASDPASSGCTGSTWADCIKLVATPIDPQSRLVSKIWATEGGSLFRFTNPSSCEPYTRQGDDTISSQLYCGHNGYQCKYRYSFQYTDRTESGDVWTNADFQDRVVNINAIPCVSGSAIDGYIQEALIFADLNHNLSQDVGEPTTTTNVQGQFSFNTPIPSDALLILKGGIDSTTGVSFPENYTLIGYSSKKDGFVISPISTLNYFLNDANLNETLGLEYFDVYNDDPVIQMPSDDASKVLETNMRLSVLVSSIAEITQEKDFTKIFQEISKVMKLNDLKFTAFGADTIVNNTIQNIAIKNNLDLKNLQKTSSVLTEYLGEISIDSSEVYLDKFKNGITTTPMELKELFDEGV